MKRHSQLVHFPNYLRPGISDLKLLTSDKTVKLRLVGLRFIFPSNFSSGSLIDGYPRISPQHLDGDASEHLKATWTISPSRLLTSSVGGNGSSVS